MGHGVLDELNIEAMESMVKKKVLCVAARFLEKMLNADLSDYAGNTLTCIFCGKEARYVSRHLKTFTTILGDITLARAYYYCPSCGCGWCPKDYNWGFNDSSLSPGVTRMISLVASADAVLNAIDCHKTRPGEIGEKAAKEFDYFTTNRRRMRYDYFRSLGLCVGSGVVEAGCRVVIGQRLKRSGMFWSLNGANAIIALRSSLLSGRFDDFWVRYRANNCHKRTMKR